MLTFIDQLPDDKPIAGVHCVPILSNGSLIMVWDKDEQGLTTIGGKIEGTETLKEALNREALEEAGLILENNHNLLYAGTGGIRIHIQYGIYLELENL